jgi:CheY-like chemotaxis protein
MMGGKIGLESELGVGTEFWFTIALDKQPAAAPAPKIFSGTSVLVVKGRAIYRQALTQQLAALGCNFAVSENFADAENQLAQRAAAGEPFTVVLAGQAAGDVTAFTQNVRNHPRLQQVRLVKLTPFGSRASAADLTAAGFAGQLGQPFRRSQLVECLAQVLQKNNSNAGAQVEKLSTVNTTPLRVLIVDDNNTNLVVICKILEKLGHRPLGVGSGAEGIAKLQSPDFDLVLMDCQMPDMDGYEATRNIRNGAAGEHSRTLPIVALTANVLGPDQQRCFDAGMDGYLGKPIQMDALRAALEKWKPKNGTPAVSTASSETETADNNFSPEFVSTTGKAIFNRADLMNRMLDDMEMATLTAQAFMDDLPKQTAALLKAVASGDATATASAAHRLKGAAGTMGGDSLHYLLGEIERLGKAKDMEAVAPLAAQIEAEAAALAEMLTNEILHAPPDPFGVPFAEKV